MPHRLNAPHDCAATAGQLHTQQPRATLTLGRSVSWTLISNFVFAACQGCLLFAAAKFGSAEAVGQFSVALAVNTPIFMFAQLNSRQVYVSDVAEQFSLADFMWLRILTVFAAAIAAYVVVYLSGYTGAVSQLVGVFFIAKAFESISDLLHGVFQKADRLDVASISMLIRGPLSLAFFVGSLLLNHDIVQASVLMAACSGGVLLLYDIPKWYFLNRSERSKFRVRPQEILNVFQRSFPLGLSAGCMSVSACAPRYILQSLLGSQAVGIYSIAYAPLAICATVADSIRTSMLAQASRYYQAHDLYRLRQLTRRLNIIIFWATACASLVFLLFGDFVVRWVFGPSLQQAYPCVVLLSIGQIIASFGASGSIIFNASHRFWMNPIAACIGLAALIPLSWVCTEYFGLYGAASADSLRHIFSTAFIVLGSRRILTGLTGETHSLSLTAANIGHGQIAVGKGAA